MYVYVVCVCMWTHMCTCLRSPGVDKKGKFFNCLFIEVGSQVSPSQLTPGMPVSVSSVLEIQKGAKPTLNFHGS